jgi:hypothetical protein
VILENASSRALPGPSSPRRVTKSQFKAHALIWWASGDLRKLSPRVLNAIEAELERSAQPGESPGLLVSAISCWEVAMLASPGGPGPTARE